MTYQVNTTRIEHLAMWVRLRQHWALPISDIVIITLPWLHVVTLLQMSRELNFNQSAVRFSLYNHGDFNLKVQFL
jgi:hypothetical protein